MFSKKKLEYYREYWIFLFLLFSEKETSWKLDAQVATQLFECNDFRFRKWATNDVVNVLGKESTRRETEKKKEKRKRACAHCVIFTYGPTGVLYNKNGLFTVDFDSWVDWRFLSTIKSSLQPFPLCNSPKPLSIYFFLPFNFPSEEYSFFFVASSTPSYFILLLSFFFFRSLKLNRHEGLALFFFFLFYRFYMQALMDFLFLLSLINNLWVLGFDLMGWCFLWQKVVLKLELSEDRAKKKAMKTVSGISGTVFLYEINK